MLDYLRERSVQQIKEYGPPGLPPAATDRCDEGRPRRAASTTSTARAGPPAPPGLYARRAGGAPGSTRLRRVRGKICVVPASATDVAVRRSTGASSAPGSGTSRPFEATEHRADADGRVRHRAARAAATRSRRTSTSTSRPTPCTSRSPPATSAAPTWPKPCPPPGRAVRRGVPPSLRRTLRSRSHAALGGRETDDGATTRARSGCGCAPTARCWSWGTTVVDDEGAEHPVTRPVVALCTCGRSSVDPLVRRHAPGASRRPAGTTRMSDAQAVRPPRSCRTMVFDGLRIRYDERVLTPRPWTVLQSRWAADRSPSHAGAVACSSSAPEPGTSDSPPSRSSSRRLVCVTATSSRRPTPPPTRPEPAGPRVEVLSVADRRGRRDEERFRW